MSHKRGNTEGIKGEIMGITEGNQGVMPWFDSVVCPRRTRGDTPGWPCWVLRVSDGA